MAYDIFSRWGFGAIALPALLPPPLPMVPFLLVAATMQYPLRKFLFALTLGRMIRYALLALLALLAARYGRQILAFSAQHSYPALFAVMALAGIVAAALFVIFIGKRQHRSQD
jgi:membrane protein DedA with SNARE-associated domain